MLPSDQAKVTSAYRVLGVEAGATDEEIRAAYIALVKQFHPDVGGRGAQLEEKLKRVNVAFRLLRDPALRRRYDERLRKASRRRPLLPRGMPLSRRPRYAKAAGGLLLVGLGVVLLISQKPTVPKETRTAAGLPREEVTQKIAPGKQDSLRNWRRPALPEVAPPEMQPMKEAALESPKAPQTAPIALPSSSEPRPSVKSPKVEGRKLLRPPSKALREKVAVLRRSAPPPTATKPFSDSLPRLPARSAASDALAGGL